MNVEPITSLNDPLDEIDEREDENERIIRPGSHRVVGLAVLLGLTLLLLWGRLYYLQILHGADFREQADNNRFRIVPIPAPRGVIYDRNRVVLARNRPSYSIGFVPADLPDSTTRATVLKRLADIVNVPVAKLQAASEKGSGSPFNFVTLVESVPQATAFQIEERHREVPGVQIRLLPVRDYPFGPITAPILGYVGRISQDQYLRLKDDSVHRYSQDDVIGQTGIERTFEAQLRGAPGEEQMEVDATGREVRSLQVTNPSSGNNLVLTIDNRLQKLAADTLNAGIDRYHTASVVALDPRNGQVLAMVNVPSYDNNLFSNGIRSADLAKLINDPRHPLLNGAVGAAYPPGTTFDPITAIAGLESGTVTPKTEINCRGYLSVPNRFDPTVATKLFDWKELGPQDVESAIADSCRVYWYQVGGGDPSGKWAGVGVDGLARFAHLFGLGDRTGIDLVEEITGLVPTVRWKRQTFNDEWVPMDTYQMSVGEGYLTATPLQLASVAATIANGGKVYRPQLVLDTLDSQGNLTTGFTPDVEREIPARSANLQVVRQGMIDATGTGKTANGFAYDGTARAAAVPGFTIGGATGSVEYGIPDAKGNLPTHGWFIGFAPAEHPTIALSVFVENGTGSGDAAQIAHAIFSEYLTRLNTAPTR